MSENSVDRRSVVVGLGAAAVGGVCSTLGVGRVRSAEEGGQSESPPEDYDAVLASMDGDGTPSSPYVITDVGELQAMAGARDAHFVLVDHVDASPTDAWNDTTRLEREFVGLADDSTVTTAHAPLVEGSVAVYLEPKREGDPTRVPPGAYDVEHDTGEITFDAAPGSENATLLVDYELREPVARGFSPIGSREAPFLGSFDGRGYSVRHLTVRRPGTADSGLFGQVGRRGSDVTPRVTNVHLVEATVHGRTGTATLAGSLDGGTVRNVAASGTVIGRRGTDVTSSTGGLVGNQWGGTISASRSATTVEGGGYSGGLVGTTYRGAIDRCVATGDVAGEDKMGGLVGRLDGTVIDSRATGDVTGVRSVGGFCGAVADTGTIEACVATGAVTGEADLGGFVGGVRADGTVRSCYATGRVQAEGSVGHFAGWLSENGTVTRSFATGTGDAESDAGGLVGFMSDTFQEAGEEAVLRNAYWDATRTGAADAVYDSDADGGTLVVDGVEGLETAEMQGETARSNVDALDFAETWRVPDAGAYPSLRRTIEAGPTPVPALSIEPSAPEPGEQVTFDASGSRPEDAIEGFSWRFPDDGATASGPTTRRSFASDGVYEVALAVSHNRGQRVTLTGRIAVGSATVPEPTSTPTMGSEDTDGGSPDGATDADPEGGGATTGGDGPGLTLTGAITGVAAALYVLRRRGGDGG